MFQTTNQTWIFLRSLFSDKPTWWTRRAGLDIAILWTPDVPFFDIVRAEVDDFVMDFLVWRPAQKLNQAPNNSTHPNCADWSCTPCLPCSCLQNSACVHKRHQNIFWFWLVVSTYRKQAPSIDILIVRTDLKQTKNTQVQFAKQFLQTPWQTRTNMCYMFTSKPSRSQNKW